MTADEMKQRNVAAMGEALGKQYSALFHEITALHLYWNEFIELFGTNDKRIKRLNQTAPGFFQMLQEQQFETNMSHLARLTDAPKSMGKENLTVRSLPNLVIDKGLKDRLAAQIDLVIQKTKFCRDWRNRRFAHHDLKLAIGDGQAMPLTMATKEQVAEALQSLADLMNVMERFYYKNVCSFNDVAAHGGAATLLHMLGFGVIGHERWLEKINKGDFSAAVNTPEHI